MKTKSNRERRAALIFKFSFTVFARLQFEYNLMSIYEGAYMMNKNK